jgi:hypothetical protein
MKILFDVMRMIWRLLSFARSRVTVSREEQIICANSSCVKLLLMVTECELFVPDCSDQSSNNLANFARAVWGSSSDLARSVSSAISRLNICEIA